MIRVGITHGDINGIGYEVILKTFEDSRMIEICTPVIYGSPKVAAYHRKALDLQPIPFNQINDAHDIQDNRVNIVNCIEGEVKVELGTSTEAAGNAAFIALERASEDLKEGLIDVLVTAPINKYNIQREDFRFPGHTEYLGSKFGESADESLMMFVNGAFRVALLTSHIALADVAKQITTEKIEDIVTRLDATLKRDFQIGKPKIAVLGLNPHAGENGLLGTEEAEIIVPAIKNLQDKHILCFGPFSADGFFGSGNYTQFDMVLAMYHDQGLIPFKALSMESGVNFTAGLPIVRTSPAHGTAYDLAGKNMANEESLRQSVYIAIDVFRNRKLYDETHANPLKKLYVEKGSDNEVLDLSGEA